MVCVCYPKFGEAEIGKSCDHFRSSILLYWLFMLMKDFVSMKVGHLSENGIPRLASELYICTHTNASGPPYMYTHTHANIHKHMYIETHSTEGLTLFLTMKIHAC